MKKSILGLCVISLLFAGCMASTYKEMIEDKSVVKKRFQINQNYIDLYKQGLERIESCYEKGAFTAAFVADGEIITDKNEATIKIYLIGGLGKQFHHAIKINSINNVSSDVTIYSYWSEEKIDIIKKELVGECKCNCE